MKIIKSIALLFFFTITNNIAQWNFSISADNEYNDNPFHSIYAEKTFINSFQLGIENNLDAISLGYNFGYYNFASIPDRNFLGHQLYLLGDLEILTFGAAYEKRIGKSLYSYYDYSNLFLYMNTSHEFNGFYLSLTPNFSFTNYDQIEILNNYKLSLSYSLNRGFETNTTAIIGGSFNYKKYTNPSQSGTYIYFDEQNNLIEEAFQDQNISSISQILSYFRLAQSITETTGMAFQFTNRSILNGVASNVKELNLYYGDESEIFDDPVNYEGNGISLEITKVFDEAQLKAAFFMNKKNYLSQGIYDENFIYNTDINRADTQNILSLSVSKNFNLNENENSSISLKLGFDRTMNTSNSYIFNYNSNSINLNIGLEF